MSITVSEAIIKHSWDKDITQRLKIIQHLGKSLLSMENASSRFPDRKSDCGLALGAQLSPQL